VIDLQALANLGEVIGAAAVIASLLYLAVQVRQGTRAQRTENYARMLERISSIQSRLSQDGALSRIFAVGVRDTSELTPIERIRFTWALYESFDAFEFIFLTYHSKEMNAEVWRRWSRTIAWWLSYPGVQSWWESRPVQFTASFTAYVETILRDNPTDATATERWQVFVAGSAATEAGQ